MYKNIITEWKPRGKKPWATEYTEDPDTGIIKWSNLEFKVIWLKCFIS